MTYEDFHRWTVSKELERPDVADVMTEARKNIAALPRRRDELPASLQNYYNMQNRLYGQAIGPIRAEDAYNNAVATASNAIPHLPNIGARHQMDTRSFRQSVYDWFGWR